MSSVTKNSEGSKDSSNVSNKIYYKRLLSFTESGETCDVEFRVGLGNVVIRGHKAVFSVASDVFYAMFYSELKEEKVVIVEDLDSDGFQSMKEFIYTGEINFNSLTHALTTFIAARKYIVSELVFNCTEYIENNIHPTELLEFFEYCQMYKVSEFEKLCFRIVREKTDKVMESKHFIAAKPETVEFVLKSLSLTLKSEVAVFDYFEKWALAEADRRNIKAGGIASSFNILKDYMKFSNITADDFVSKISQSMLFTSEEKLAISIKLLKIHTDSKVENLPSFPRVLKKCSTRLTFPIEGTCSSNTYTIELGTYSFNIDFFKKYGYIIFTITPLLNSNARLGNDFLTIYTELRVLGNGRFYDDLIFKNDSKLIVGESGDKKKQTSDLEFSKQQILAAIFIGDLRNERFLRGVDNKNVTVVGTFVITKNAGNLFLVSSPSSTIITN